MCCNEFSSNEYWKSVCQRKLEIKFVTISQTGVFNAVRIIHSIKRVVKTREYFPLDTTPRTMSITEITSHKNISIYY